MQAKYCLLFVSIWSLTDSKLQTVTRPIDLRYDPTWDSLDSRPLPQWYDDAKFGIFIHWGVFSVPSFGSEWFWSNWQIDHNDKYEEFMTKNYPPGFTYQDFARDFKAEFYDPEQWADLFQAAGAKYIVLTSKHHEGYTLWPSQNSFSWNAQDVGPNRNVLGDLATAIRNRTQLKFGLYHSLYEWFNPLYLQDKANNFTTREFVTTKTVPELYDLVNTYQPEIVWSDGDWETTDTYWTSKEFIAWLYNSSPVKETVVTNDRWGTGVLCNHGDFFTCSDRFSPGVLQPHKWENCLTIDKQSWGFRRNAKLEEYMTIQELVEELVKTVSCGGNMLLNVGPTKDGIVTPIYEERLRQLGSWLQVNGEAIYSSKPWTYQNDTYTPGVWYTAKSQYVYASVTTWPATGQIELLSPKLSSSSVVTLLGYDGQLSWRQFDDAILVDFPDKNMVGTNWAYVLKLTNVQN